MELRQLSALLRYAKTGCEQTVTDCIANIRPKADEADLFTYVAREDAIAEARVLDERGEYHSAIKPLAGIPFAVQETISVDGQPGSAASALDVSDLIPVQGPVVKKLRDMGAVAIGKTASTEFSFSLHNLTRPLPANPHYTGEDYTMGGNAAAIAIARGLCCFALGADTVGTMRASAAMCGITGFKPGADFWSREGAFPLSRELDCIGLLTPSAKDMAFMLEQLGTGTAPDLSNTKLRLGISRPAFYQNLDPVVAEAMVAALETLSKKGAMITELSIPNYDELKNFNRIANGTGLARYIGRDRITAGFSQLDPVTQLRVKSGMDAHISDIQHLFEVRRLLANRVNSNLAHIDALVMPTLTGLPVPVASLADAEAVQEWHHKMMVNINFAGLFNMAAVTIPLPASQPIGLQLVAPSGSEVRLVAVARAIEGILGAAG